MAQTPGCLQIYRSNAPYFADIKAGAALWCVSVIFFTVFLAATDLIDSSTRGAGKPPPFGILSINELGAVVLLCTIAIVVNLLPAIVGLSTPRTFLLDRSRNQLLVEGREIGPMERALVQLEYSFGWSRRAFRLVLSVAGQSYVVAHTQKQTLAILTGKEYIIDVLGQDLQEKRWFNTWSPYAGETSGFDPTWPEYREIFSLYATITEFVASRGVASNP